MPQFTLLIAHAHADGELAQKLATYLSEQLPLREIHCMSTGGGDAGNPLIFQANMALLLLTTHFLAEEVENSELLDELLSRTMEDHFHLLPLIAEDCEWEDSPYAGLPVLPFERIALFNETAWGGVEKALAALAQQLAAQLDLQQLQLADPKAYAQRKAAPVAKRGAFTRHLLRLFWRNMPKRLKWGIISGLGILLLLLIYLIFG